MPAESISWMKYIVNQPKQRNEEMPVAMQTPTTTGLPAFLRLSHDSYNRLCHDGIAVTSPLQFANSEIASEFMGRLDGFGQLQNALSMSLYLFRKALGGRKPARGWGKADDLYLEKCLSVLKKSKGNPTGAWENFSSVNIEQTSRFLDAMTEIIEAARAAEATEANQPQDAETTTEES